MLQSCCDLLGELVKFSPYVLLLLQRHFAANPAAFAVFCEVLLYNLIDSNVLIRSLYLTREFCSQVGRVQQLAAAAAAPAAAPAAAAAAPAAPAKEDAEEQQEQPKAAAATGADKEAEAAATAATAATAAAAAAADKQLQKRLLPLWRQLHFYDRNASSNLTLHGGVLDSTPQQQQQQQQHGATGVGAGHAAAAAAVFIYER